MTGRHSDPPTDDLQFGLTNRQLNLFAVRLQTLLKENLGTLESAKATLNVAQSGNETVDIDIEAMSPSVLLVFVLQTIAANNAALDGQLRALGLEPLRSAGDPSIDL